MAMNAAAGRADWIAGDSGAAKREAEEVKREVTVMGKDGSNVSSREMFQRVRARLRAAVGEDVYSSWFARL